MPEVQISSAELSDISAIQKLLQPYVDTKIVLPRSEAQIKNDLPYTWIARYANEIAGVVNLTFFQPDLAEVRGLVVRKNMQRHHIGQALVLATIQFLKNNPDKKVNTLFALTYIPDFFLSIGFSVVQKEKFPPKIYEVCQFCDKRDNCQEIAVELNLLA